MIIGKATNMGVYSFIHLMNIHCNSHLYTASSHKSHKLICKELPESSIQYNILLVFRQSWWQVCQHKQWLQKKERGRTADF